MFTNKETIFDCLDESQLIFTCCHVDVLFSAASQRSSDAPDMCSDCKYNISRGEERQISPLACHSPPHLFTFVLGSTCDSEKEINRSLVAVLGYQIYFPFHVDTSCEARKHRQVVLHRCISCRLSHDDKSFYATRLTFWFCRKF